MSALKHILNHFYGAELTDGTGHVTHVNESFLKQVNREENPLSLGGYRLLLKPLSQITDADLLKIGEIEYADYGSDLSKIEMAKILLLNFDKLGALPATVLYLAAMHYDILNLIPQGLAVELNTNTTPKPPKGGFEKDSNTGAVNAHKAYPTNYKTLRKHER